MGIVGTPSEAAATAPAKNQNTAGTTSSFFI
jgi:hypothetical protein